MLAQHPSHYRPPRTAAGYRGGFWRVGESASSFCVQSGTAGTPAPLVLHRTVATFKIPVLKSGKKCMTGNHQMLSSSSTNWRGDRIRTPSYALSTSRSLSPVTIRSAFAATATASTASSSESRQAAFGSAAGFTRFALSRYAFKNGTSFGSTSNFLRSLSSSSASRILETNNSCAGNRLFTMSRQRPSATRPAMRTLVSQTTFTKPDRKRLHRCKCPSLALSERACGGLPQMIAAIVDLAGHAGQIRFP